MQVDSLMLMVMLIPWAQCQTPTILFKLYNDIPYDGTDTGTPILVTAGTYTAMVDFDLDDSLLY